MAVDFDLLRKLARKAAAEDHSFEIGGLRPKLEMNDSDDPEFLMRIEIPIDEGIEFSHWRLMHEAGFVRVSHNGRPGISKLNNRLDGLTAKGLEFIELSRDEEAWQHAVEVCRQALALTIPNVMRHLRLEARRRIRTASLGLAKKPSKFCGEGAA